MYIYNIKSLKYYYIYTIGAFFRGAAVGLVVNANLNGNHSHSWGMAGQDRGGSPARILWDRWPGSWRIAGQDSGNSYVGFYWFWAKSFNRVYAAFSSSTVDIPGLNT